MYPENQPKITIGLPVYNGAATLNRAIESLLGQTWHNIELIISNNASTDETAAICDAWKAKDPRIRVIHQTQNLGCIPNFQFVLAQATGEYFMWGACDDQWAPTFVEKLIGELERYPYAHVAMCSLQRVYEDGTLMDIIAFHRHHDPNKMSKTQLHQALLSGELYHFWVSGVFRTTVLQPMGPHSIRPIFGADRWLMAHFALRSKFRYVKDLLFTKSYSGRALSEKYPGEASFDTTLGTYLSTGIHLAQILGTSPWLSLGKKCLIPLSIVQYYWVYGLSYLQHRKNVKKRQKRLQKAQASLQPTDPTLVHS